MLLWIAMAAWLIGVTMSLNNGHKTLPVTILFLGTLDCVGIFYYNLGWIGLTILAVLALVILIANKLDPT